MIKGMFSDLTSFRHDPLSFFEEKGKSEEPIVKLKMGPAPVYMVVDPKCIKPVLAAKEEVIDKGKLIYKLREVIGDSSMVISGERHKARRAAIHSQIAKGITANYVPSISAIIRRDITRVCQRGKFDCHELTASLAVGIIASILFGDGVLSSGDEAVLVDALHLAEEDLAAEIFRILPDLPWVRYRKKKLLKQAKQNMNFVVQKTRSKAKRHSLISALEELKLTEKEMNEEILLLLLAGHHTSGTAAAWILYYLATNPDLCSQLRQEAHNCIGDDLEFDPNLLSHASKSIAFVKEVLRLYPSAYWLSRETKVPMEINGIRIPKKASILISPWQIHRDPRNWNDPEKFDITRDHKGSAYLPFGSGPRVCVGMSLGLLELQLIALEFASAVDLECHTNNPGQPIPAITIVPPKITLSAKPAEYNYNHIAAE